MAAASSLATVTKTGSGGCRAWGNSTKVSMALLVAVVASLLSVSMVMVVPYFSPNPLSPMVVMSLASTPITTLLIDRSPLLLSWVSGHYKDNSRVEIDS